MSQCLIKVKTQLAKANKEFNQQVLNEMLEEIKELKDKSRTKDGFRKKLDAFVKETGEEKIINEFNAAIQAAKYSEAKRIIDNAPTKVEGLLSLIRGSNYAYEGAGVNLENIQAARVNKYMAIIEQSFSESELKALASKGMDRDIILYMASNGKKGNPSVKKFADTLKKLGLYIHEDKIKTGIMENFLADRVMNQKHLYNIEKMQVIGKEAWAELVYSKLDHDKSFPYLETKEERIKYLENTFENILKKGEEMQSMDFSKVPKERIKGQLVKRYSKQRQLHYTPEGLADMFEQFSDRSLIESVISEATRVSKDIASFEVFGPAGSNGFHTLVQKEIKSLQKELKTHKVNSPEWSKVNKELEDVIAMRDGKKKYHVGFNGYMKEFYSSSFDGKNGPSVLENVRTLTAASSLGMTTFGAITDIGFGIAAINSATGGGLLKSSTEELSRLGTMLSGEKRRKTLVRFAIGLESQLGNILRGASAQGNFSKGMAKVSYLHHVINPLAQQATVTRAAVADYVSMEFADWVTKSMDKLAPETQSRLKKAGIDEIDFASLNEMKTDVGQGEFSIDTVSTSKISDEVALKAIESHKAKNPNFIPKTADQYRAHLEKRLDSFYIELAHDAAPKPGLKEKVTLSFGSEKNTLQREVFDTLTMFKSFSIKQMNIMQKTWLSNPTREGKVKHFSAMAVGLLTTAYLAESLYSLAKNETPPDPSDPETMKRVLLRSGLGGMFADAVLGKDDWATTFVAGPVVGKAQESLNAIRQGEPEKLAKNLPFQNYAPLVMGLNYTIMDDWKEASRPGHKRRMEQRRKEREGLLWKQESVIE